MTGPSVERHELTWPDLVTTLLTGTDLSSAQTTWAMDEILAGNASPVQIAGFVVALRGKGETVAEISGLIEAMYRHAVPIDLPGRWVDVVGTGGDRSMSVNISTMAAIVTAGAGVPVIKHGNRSASSKAGAADVLEVLGVRLDLSPDDVARVALEAGISFCFAPAFHPALRHAAVARKELGVATVFNFLGPLANPGAPAAQAIGCADSRMAPIMAGVFAERGVDAWVFRGDDGLDELTTTTTSRMWVVGNGAVQEMALDPTELGVPLSAPGELRGGDAPHNAEVVRRTLAGEAGAVRDAVLLNAAAAIAVHDAAAGTVMERLAAGLERAAEAVDSGRAEEALDRWVAASGQSARP